MESIIEFEFEFEFEFKEEKSNWIFGEIRGFIEYMKSIA